MTEVLLGDAVSPDPHHPSLTASLSGLRCLHRVRLSKLGRLGRHLCPLRHPALRGFPDMPPVI